MQTEVCKSSMTPLGSVTEMLNRKAAQRYTIQAVAEDLHLLSDDDMTVMS